ncbi:hypothetical protein Desor_5305 [Desulfosporosinus orientis DSM 765]|uniref:Outer membrane protein n=1 Tax=Desulfosporosinus orientis (strain ATCC 19365 / DSM 765 / NCIMB 8382 / VKM B-1628 / Singapore I) TaxID=768706 RepID=G7WC66_DESOD|nr:TolC family protein [Desulfosporosinus orientis]AET70684.1 hypothetical protein Desor_5305 [Desulfosporosinus orientis DSM 765]
MKKLFGVSVLSVLLLFGQPLMVLADSNSRTINFDDIESIITENNLTVQMNENNRLKSYANYSGLKGDIKDLEDDIENLNDQRDGTSDTTQIITIAAQKRALLEALKQAERYQVDKPTLEAIADLQASMNNDIQVLTAETAFINYNQTSLDLANTSLNVETLQDQLIAKELQESLGLVANNDVNVLRTQLVGLKTGLESTKYKQDSLERQLKNLLNDQENDLVIGSIPSDSDNFVIEDQEGDLAKALENSYAIKLQEDQIVILQAALDRAKKDHGMSSTDYKQANYDLDNANLKLTQLKDTLTSSYYNMVDSISSLQSDLRHAKQTLADKKVTLSNAQLEKSLGMISQLELNAITADYQAQENTVKTKEINLFNAKCNYDWFLKGMSQS